MSENDQEINAVRKKTNTADVTSLVIDADQVRQDNLQSQRDAIIARCKEELLQEYGFNATTPSAMFIRYLYPTNGDLLALVLDGTNTPQMLIDCGTFTKDIPTKSMQVKFKDDILSYKRELKEVKNNSAKPQVPVIEQQRITTKKQGKIRLALAKVGRVVLSVSRAMGNLIKNKQKVSNSSYVVYQNKGLKSQSKNKGSLEHLSYDVFKSPKSEHGSSEKLEQSEDELFANEVQLGSWTSDSQNSEISNCDNSSISALNSEVVTGLPPQQQVGSIKKSSGINFFPVCARIEKFANRNKLEKSPESEPLMPSMNSGVK